MCCLDPTLRVRTPPVRQPILHQESHPIKSHFDLKSDVHDSVDKPREDSRGLRALSMAEEDPKSSLMKTLACHESTMRCMMYCDTRSES